MDSYSLTIKDYEKTIELNPEHVDALMKCAILYGKNNKREMACEYSKRACELGNGEACSGNNKFCNQ
ncbi:MAG: hypothetical protein ACTIJ9_07310 [Aequorivita sp.]